MSKLFPHSVLSFALVGTLLLSSCTIEIPFNRNTNSTSPSQEVTPIPTTNINQNANTPSTPTGLLGALDEKKTTLSPSRESLEGCTWKEMEEKELGVRFLIQECMKGPTFEFQKNQLLLKDPSLGTSPLMVVFYKQGNETDEEVLKRLFLNKLSPELQNKCTIKRENITETSIRTDIERYTIAPNDSYQKELEAKGEPFGGQCGDYGAKNAREFFQFQKDKSKFVYIYGGQDVSLLDEESLEITK